MLVPYYTTNYRVGAKLAAVALNGAVVAGLLNNRRSYGVHPRICRTHTNHNAKKDEETHC